MSLKDYKNYDEIKDNRTKTQGSFVDTKTKALIEVGVEFPFAHFGIDSGSGRQVADDNIEFHAYTIDDNPLGSKETNCHYEVASKKGGDGAAILNLKPVEELNELGFNLGRYKYVYNIYKKLTHNNLYIHQISPSRTEVLLKPVKTRNFIKDFQTNVEFMHFANKVNIGAEVGFEMFDVNQDGNVSVLDIVEGLNPDNEFVQPPLTSAEAWIISDYILGYNPEPNYVGNDTFGDPSNPRVKLTLDYLEKNGIDVRNPDNPHGSNEEAWLKLANRLLENYKLFDKLNPDDLNIYLNFGGNNFSLVTNWMQDKFNYPEQPHGIVVKLLEPLSEEIIERQQLSLVQFYSPPVVDKISLVGTPLTQRKLNVLAPHNKNVDVGYLKPKQMEDYETWEEILGYNPTTSQNIIDFYLSGSHLEQRVNIDYTDYRNFVKFGSAYERLANFKYKLGLIETYDSKSDAYFVMSGSHSSYQRYKGLKEQVISGLDGYEKFLYYESGSYISESGLGAVGTLDFQDATAPKMNSSKPYILYSTTSSQFTTWYDNQLSNALNHDNFNEDSLQDNVPMHLKSDNSNAEYLLFLNMIGQHFDTVWTYAKHMTDIADRTHNINTSYNFSPHISGSRNHEGLDKGLTYFIARSKGLKLNDGQDLVKLWKYALGENQFSAGTLTVSGNKITIADTAFSNDLEDGTLYIPASENPSGSAFEATLTNVYHTSASISPAYNGEFSSSNYSITYDIEGSVESSLSANDYTKEIWRRLLNNLPYLLKTKGTARSIKALISCYGIPQTILDIREYGGPTDVGKQIFSKSYFGYGLHYTGSNQYVEVPWKKSSKTSRTPDSLQFRFAFDIDKNKEDVVYNFGSVTNMYQPHISSSEGNHNSVRLATLGGGATGSANWEIRANTLTGSALHDMGKAPASPSVDFIQGTGIPSYASFNAISASTDHWGYLSFNLSGSEGYKTILSDVYPIFDGGFWQVVLQRTSGSDSKNIAQTYELHLKRAEDNKITFSSVTSMSLSSSQTSYMHNYTSSDYLYIGNSGSDIDGGFFSGSIQEVRLWNKKLEDKSINIHTRAPFSYAGGTTSSFYDNLEARFPFNEIYEHETVGVSTPNVYSSSNIANITTYMTTASLVNFGTTNKSYKEFEIQNNFQLPNIGANRLTSNKIRTEDTYLDGNLNVEIRSEKRAHDYAPIDSPKLDVYFSPSQPINEDIIADFAGLELDDFLGDPEDIYKDKYTELEKVRNLYFDRVDNLNNFFDYIRLIQMYDSTLFDHIKSLIPHRAHESVGLLIEPNILERPKFSGWKPLVRENKYFQNDKVENVYGEDIATDYTGKGTGASHSLDRSVEFLRHTGSVDMGVDNMTAEADLYNVVGGELFNDTVTLGNSLIVEVQKTGSLTAPTVDDYSPIFSTKFPISSSLVVTMSADFSNGDVRPTGSVEDGLQNSLTTTYLADITTKDTHQSSSYIVGFGGAGYASHSEDWHGNPEKEGLHPFVHKHILSNRYLIHSSSKYECVLTDGTITEKPMVPYGYWDNDRSITGSIDSGMAGKGFLPAECTPPNTYAYKSQKYMGTKNKITTTYDGKDAFEVHETTPNVLVVSDTSPNTLQVQ